MNGNAASSGTVMGTHGNAVEPFEHDNTDLSGTLTHMYGNVMRPLEPDNTDLSDTVTHGNVMGLVEHEIADLSDTVTQGNVTEHLEHENTNSSETEVYGYAMGPLKYENTDFADKATEDNAILPETSTYVSTDPSFTVAKDNTDSLLQELLGTTTIKKKKKRLRPPDCKVVEEWMNAAKNGDVHKLAVFLKCCFVSVDERDPIGEEGETALVHACERGQLEAAKFLIKCGADVNIQTGGWRLIVRHAGSGQLARFNTVGDRVLHSVIETGFRPNGHGNDQAVIRLLVTEGADINGRNNYGQTPVMLAAERLNPRAIELLLELGCDVNCHDMSGCTALHYCFRTSHEPQMESSICCATLLINAGADMDMIDSVRFTPLITAIRNKNTRGARFLIMQNCNPDLPDRVTENLTDASEENDSENETDTGYENKSPFYACLYRNDLKTLKLLLQAGCRFEDCSDINCPEDLKDQVQKLVSQPRRLTESCRVVLRRTLRLSGGVGRRLKEKVEQLSVPSLLKDFILFMDIKLDPCSVS